MNEIKMKPSISTPKQPNAAARLPKGLGESLMNTRNAADEIRQQNSGREESPENNASDQVIQKISDGATTGTHLGEKAVSRMVRHGLQAREERADEYNEVSYRANRASFQGGKHRVQQSAQTPVSRSGMARAGRQSVKGTIKTAQRGVKASKHAVKSSARTIKTSTKTIKVTAKAAKVAAKASVQAMRAARATAKAIATGIKLMIKAVIAAVKVIIAAVKGLVAAIAAGGWVVVVIIIVVAALAFLFCSPFGIFFNGGAESTPTLSDAILTINTELSSRIEAIKRSAGPVEQIIIEFDGREDKHFIDNWPDILAVFAVKVSLNTESPMDVMVMDEQRMVMLREVFWDMVSIEHSISDVEGDSTVSASTATASLAPTTAPKRTLSISVNTCSWDGVINIYSFTDQQIQMMNEMMSASNYKLLLALVNTAVGTPAKDWSSIIDVPEGGMPIPLYLQGDYPQTVCYFDGVPKSVKSSGCGAASVSMVIAYLTGNTGQTPYTLFKWAYDHGYYTGGGLGHSCLQKLAELYGVKVTWIENDEARITETLRAGYPVIAHMGPGIFTDEGHYIVLRGITEDGYVLVNDSGSRNRNRYAYLLTSVIQQARTDKAFMICK